MSLKVLNRAKVRAQLRAFTRAGHVVRFHTRSMVKPQDVAQHVYGVVWLCYVLRDGGASAQLLVAALTHDLPEFITGDLPSPTKKSIGHGVMQELEGGVFERVGFPHDLEAVLTPDERRVLHLADCLEGMLRCAYERSLGNQLLGSCFRRYQEAARELLESDVDQYVWQFINEKWRSYERG